MEHLIQTKKDLIMVWKNFGIIEEEKQRLIRKYERQGNEEMLRKVKAIDSAEDLFAIINT